MKKFSIGETVAYAWKKVMDNWLFLCGLTAGIYGVSLLIQNVLHNSRTDSSLAILGLAINLFFTLFISVAFARVGLIEGRGHKAGWSDVVSKDNSMYAKMFLLLLVMAVIIAVIGLISFMLIGIIGARAALAVGVVFSLFASVKLRFASYALIDGKSPIDSIKASFDMTNDHFWSVLGFIFFLALINIGGAIAFLIGLLVTIPLSVVAMGKAYHSLKS